MKSKLSTILIIGITVILAGVAVFTAVRLYQTRQQPVAPSAPSSIPRAQEELVDNSCSQLVFTITTPSPSPSPSVTPSPSPSPSPSASPTPTSTPVASPTPTGTPKPSATPTPTLVAQASPSAEAELPEAGVNTPTLIGIGFGALLILGSLLLLL